VLLSENASLRGKVALLEEKLAFLGQHKTLAAGIAGERLVSKLTSGTMTPHVAPHDIDAGGDRIEVKYANLSRPVATAPTLRWQWQKIFGQTGAKNYTYLLLIGEGDERFRGSYLDPDSPYVFFLVPTEEVAAMCVKGSPLGIMLNSNPNSAKGSSSKLFANWQIKAADVEKRFGI
jgi:hypothetical protein